MSMAKIRVNVKDVVLPHTQAKLDLYINYLEHYLRVLSLSPYIDNINLVDAYCGSGQYKDGNFGSPILANETIHRINKQVISLGKSLSKISLHFNDIDSQKVENVNSILQNNQAANCTYLPNNLTSELFLNNTSEYLNSLKNNTRSLVFIDPYGYSDITSTSINNLIKNEYSEVLLFLPVMQMYRFRNIALNDTERSCYEGLRRFILSFFPTNHKIHRDEISDVFEFIQEIRNALSFNGNFYSCSHYIEREKGNYYALFFITSNLYGLDKMVDAKWKLDPTKGKGFNQVKIQGDLFADANDLEDYSYSIEKLKEILYSHIEQKSSLNNYEVYKIGLENEFTPAQCKIALEDLFNKKKIIYNVLEGKNLTIQHFNYNSFKKKEVKSIFVVNK